MRIVIASDHRGTAVAAQLAERLRADGHDVSLLGDCSGDSCDYPDQAFPVAHAVATGDADRGVLICGSGIGMGIAANKVAGVRAVVAMDETAAEMSRRHNDANVLCLAADRTAPETLDAIVNTWIGTEFEGGRHQRRVDKLGLIERGMNPAESGDPVGGSC